VAEAGPDFLRLVARAAKENLTRRVVGNQHQHGFRFAEAGEVVKIAVGAVGIEVAAIALAFGRGGQDGDAAAFGLHVGEQALPTGAEG